MLWAIENGGEHGRIAVAYVEWAGRPVAGRGGRLDGGRRTRPSAAAFAARLMAAPRRANGINAIGAAILKGLALIEGNALRGLRAR